MHRRTMTQIRDLEAAIFSVLRELNTEPVPPNDLINGLQSARNEIQIWLSYVTEKDL